MIKDKEYEMELEKARAEYKDLMERGDEAMGDEDEYDELEREFFTPEEIEESEFNAALLGWYVKTHKGEKIDIDKFETLSQRVYKEFKKLELVGA